MLGHNQTKCPISAGADFCPTMRAGGESVIFAKTYLRLCFTGFCAGFRQLVGGATMAKKALIALEACLFLLHTSKSSIR
jgi:hypothetical protein